MLIRTNRISNHSKVQTMSEVDRQALAAIVFLYAFFEFFLIRLFWGSKKHPKEIKQYLKQSITLFTLMVLGTLCFMSVRLIVGSVIIALVYGLYNIVGRAQQAGRLSSRSLERFIIKQMLIVLLLYALWRSASPFEISEWWLAIPTWSFLHTDPVYLWVKNNFFQITVLGTAYFFMIDGGTKIVRGILDKFPTLYERALQSLTATNNGSDGDIEEKDDDYNEEKSAGEWIGILERIITLTFVLTNSFTAIAFALTAKSIARFKELENKSFAEYYLLGTSASIATAIIVGMVVKIILQF